MTFAEFSESWKIQIGKVATNTFLDEIVKMKFL